MPRDLSIRFEFCNLVFDKQSDFPHLTLKESFESVLTLYRVNKLPPPVSRNQT